MSEIDAGNERSHRLPQPTPRLAKSERTRAAILNAALEFLWSHPFRDLTVNALMASTDASRPAFYQYFKDVSDLMETLLEDLQSEVLQVIDPWISGTGNPIELLNASLSELVRVCHERGPILRAVAEAAPHDPQLEKTWNRFLQRFDDAVTARIEADQRQGLIPDLAARPLAVALNRLDAFTLIQAFGRHPRQAPGPLLDALIQIWTSTLYASAPGARQPDALTRASEENTQAD